MRVDGEGLRLVRRWATSCATFDRHTIYGVVVRDPSFPLPLDLVIDGAVVPSGTPVFVGDGVISIGGPVPSAPGDYEAALAGGAHAVIAGFWGGSGVETRFEPRTLGRGPGFTIWHYYDPPGQLVEVQVSAPFDVQIRYYPSSVRHAIHGAVGVHSRSTGVELPCGLTCTAEDTGAGLPVGSLFEVLPASDPIGPLLDISCFEASSVTGFMDDERRFVINVENHGDEIATARVEIGAYVALWSCDLADPWRENQYEVHAAWAELTPGASATLVLAGTLLSLARYNIPTLDLNEAPVWVYQGPYDEPTAFAVTSGDPLPATVGVPFSHDLTTGPESPGEPSPVVTWTPWYEDYNLVVVGGSPLPEWLSLSPSGVLSGTPPAPGTYAAHVHGSAPGYLHARFRLDIEVR